jgi:arylsulfatase A-like enzyme
MLYEGGVRVPFIVRWPRQVPRGRICDEPTTHVDLFPTFLALAGAKDVPRQPLDGVSLLPLLRDPSTKLPREAIYAHFPGYLEGPGPGKWRTTPVGFIRAGDWKLMEFYEDGRLELYNLKDDLGETKNLAVKMPEKARELHAKLAAWRKELKAEMPRPKAAAPARPQRAADEPSRPWVLPAGHFVAGTISTSYGRMTSASRTAASSSGMRFMRSS